MIVTRLSGGLGNQLFQVYATISASINNGTDFCFFPDTSVGRRTYWNAIFKNISDRVGSHVPDIHYHEPRYEYDPIPSCVNLGLTGYFQSFKYFEKNETQINWALDIDGMKSKICADLVPEFNSNAVSIHYRFGDYLKKPDKHPVQPIEYYEGALRTLIDGGTEIKEAFIFCDKNDSDMSSNYTTALKRRFGHIKFSVIPESLQDHEQIILMGLYMNNIIANSTFSWWGAWYNTNQNKRVIYPAKWFGAELEYKSINDLIPQGWEKI